MEFKVIANYFDRLEKTSSRLEMASILKELFFKISNKEIANLIYFLQGNIGPQYNSKEINIGQAILIDLVSEYSGVSTQNIKDSFNQLGDIGLVIEKNPKKNKQTTLFLKSLSFLDVYNTLLKISKISGNNSQDLKKTQFKYLLFNLDKTSAKYIIRFPISFRLGFGDSTIIDALSFLDETYDQKEARKIISEKYDKISDLGLISKNIKEKGIESIKDLNIKYFIPIKPALCERAKDFQEIKTRLLDENKKVFAVDTKIDGFRQQIHKKGNDVKIFSRREEDITSRFPDVVENIKKINKNFIIDCEAIAYDSINKKYHNFQTTIKRKRKHDILKTSKDLPIHLKVFDILCFDNQNLIDQPFKKRRELLEKNFDIPPKITPTNIIYTDNKKDLETFFKKALSYNFEGIIAKDINSSYKAGSRGYNWIKFKKSYNSNIDSIDACVIGGFFGQGKRSDKGIGALLMGIYDKDTNKYYTIAKLGSGLSDEMLINLSKEIKDLKLLKKPDYIVSDIKPDFYVFPKIIIEINYDDITLSNLHTLKYKDKRIALRFPRVVKIRDDKSSIQTTSKKEIEKLYELENS